MEDIDRTFEKLKKPTFAELEPILVKVNGGWDIDYFRPSFHEKPIIVETCKAHGWTYDELVLALREKYEDF